MASRVPNTPKEFHIRRNDRLPFYEIDVFDVEGDPVELLNIDSVAFSMRARDGTLKVDRQAGSVVVGANGSTMHRLRYEWADEDTDTSGKYLAEFEVTFSTTLKRTFPGSPDQILRIHVSDDLDAT